MEFAITLEEQTQQLNLKFFRVCEQLRVLNKKIYESQKRYTHAQRNNIRASRYSLRIELCVLEGVRNMHYEYALRAASNLDEMRRRIGFTVLESSFTNEQADDMEH